jgi:hypothetical protein
MKRSLALAFSVILTAASVLAGDGVGSTFGGGVTLEKPVTISQLLERPDDFLGQKVRVDGVVSAVCAHRGCWMQVKDPKTDQAIRIKVEDGVIVFPASAVGKTASAEGTFEAIAIDPAPQTTPSQTTASHEGHDHAEASSYEGPEHEASCAGEPIGERIFLIRGTGAVVFDNS